MTHLPSSSSSTLASLRSAVSKPSVTSCRSRRASREPHLAYPVWRASARDSSSPATLVIWRSAFAQSQSLYGSIDQLLSFPRFLTKFAFEAIDLCFILSLSRGSWALPRRLLRATTLRDQRVLDTRTSLIKACEDQQLISHLTKCDYCAEYRAESPDIFGRSTFPSEGDLEAASQYH